MKGMKIDHEEMKKLYEAYIAEKTPQNTKDCPSPELVVSLFQPITSDTLRNEVLAHVLDCSHCTKDFQFILSVLRDEKKFINEIEDVIESTKKKDRKNKGYKSSFLQLSWKHACFLVGASIIVAAIVLNIPSKHVYRGTNLTSIRLISPLDRHYLKSDLLFEWERVENANHFILEIFDESLYPIWKSEKTTTNRMKLPNDVLAKLDPSKAYYWVVTAFLPNERILESQLQKFVVSR